MRIDHDSIRAQRFKRQWRGYDCKDVDTYLHMLANDFKEMENELVQLQREADDKNKLIAALRAQTERLRQALPPRASPAGRAPSPQPEPAGPPPAPPPQEDETVPRTPPQSAPIQKKTPSDVEALRNDIIRLKEEKQKILKTLRSHSRGPASATDSPDLTDPRHVPPDQKE